MAHKMITFAGTTAKVSSKVRVTAVIYNGTRQKFKQQAAQLRVRDPIHGIARVEFNVLRPVAVAAFFPFLTAKK